MSIFDLPRLHFAGTATTQLPTGPRSGLLDLATGRALTADGVPAPPELPAAGYDGPAGEHHGGNGHFAVDAEVSAVELRPGAADRTDPLVGRKVDLWGHYNEYLRTTVNRARVFDVDPASNWTTTLMVGQLGLGRAGRSHDSGYVLTGHVEGFQPPRWQAFQPDSAVHQFVVHAEDLAWLESDVHSPAVARLAEEVRTRADGLVVQFAITEPGAPRVPDVPRRWHLRGTIAPWRHTDSRTYPAGRLLVPVERERAPRVMSVAVDDTGVTLNMVAAAGPVLPAGDLELRTARTGKLIAAVPRVACEGAVGTGGVVWLPGGGAESDEALVLVCAHDGRVLSREQEIVLQADDACQILQHPRDADDAEHDVEIAFRSFVRGRPATVDGVGLRQFANPRALPSDPAAAQARIVRAEVRGTGEDGVGRIRLRGLRAGAARILLTAGGEPEQLSYDNDDALGFWAGAGTVTVRVLPDDWALDALPDDEVSFATVYREVFAPYEFHYSFMREEVFSLADKCKVETYAQLIWQMCDPGNVGRTYYMPPSRDLTLPKAHLLLRYLRTLQKPQNVLIAQPSATIARRGIRNRAELVSALKDAVTLELAVMLQYLYAIYSVPQYGAGAEYVRRGEWTPEQLRLACGDGGQTRDGGIRGTLVRVAGEEMIHFLLANNILMAIGEPFHVPNVDFGAINAQLPLPLDFSLERLNFASVQRFVKIEEPDGVVHEVSLGDRTGTGTGEENAHTYSSISELYDDIRQALQHIPDLFLVDSGRGGGEHHLFLREKTNERHPDYQLEVDDLPSALFAIDVITEQGEGGQLADGDDTHEESHYEAFLGVSDLLREANWVPSYPTVRNPTLRQGDRAREYVPDPDARAVMRLFNDAYAVMLQLMVQHFGGHPDTSLRRSRLMNAAIDLMTGVLRPLGELVVTMPSGLRGRTAGPSFELDETPAFISRHDVAMRRVARQLDDLAAAAAGCPLVPARVAEISTLMADQLRGS